MSDATSHSYGTVQPQMTQKTCYFCENGTAGDDHAMEKFLFHPKKKISERKVGFKEWEITYETKCVRIPRCSKCKVAHEEYNRIATQAGLIAAGLFVGMSVLFSYVINLDFSYGLVLSVVIGLPLMFWRLKTQTGMWLPTDGKYISYPEIKGLEADGWKIDHKLSAEREHNRD